MNEENITKSSKEILKELYNSDEIFKTEDEEEINVSADGSLGLLALGYKGLIAWRKVKRNKKS